jgi:hypothetical protein
MKKALQIATVLSISLLAPVGLLCQAAPASSPTNREKKILIDPQSAKSLLISIYAQGQPLGSATGFVVTKNSKDYLVTNWHVVTDHNPETLAPLNPAGLYPDEIRILHNAKGRLGTWVWKSEKLLNEKGEFLWIEHPKSRSIDVVFLSLANLEGVEIYAVDLEARNKPIFTPPTSEISIVGFPFGQSQSVGLPIWKTGWVASDTDIDYANSPQFLVDCTARPGMSGSPVYARRIGQFITPNGDLEINNEINDRFMGIFAGDIDGKSEIGRVWKASAIMEIYDSLP